VGVTERRNREKTERRADIVRAAERVFLERGIGDATMDEIAKEAEVGKGTLYLYFSSKEELLFAIQLTMMEELARYLEDAFLLGGSGMTRIENMLKAHARFATEHPRRFAMCNSLLVSSHSFDPNAESFGDYKYAAGSIFRYVCEGVEIGQDDGSVRRDVPAAELAIHLWGGSMGALLLQRRAEELAKVLPVARELENVVDSEVRLLCDALRPPDGALGSAVMEVSA